MNPKFSNLKLKTIPGFKKTQSFKVLESENLQNDMKFKLLVSSFDTLRFDDLVMGFNKRYLINTTHGGKAMIIDATKELIETLDKDENIENIIIFSKTNK